MKGCTCAFKRQMIDDMLKFQKNHPDGEYGWVSLLFENDPNDSLCCLLTFLFDYAYCKECTVPLSEAARAVLKPFMEPTE